MNAFSCISEQPIACISSCLKRPEEQPQKMWQFLQHQELPLLNAKP